MQLFLYLFAFQLTTLSLWPSCLAIMHTKGKAALYIESAFLLLHCYSLYTFFWSPDFHELRRGHNDCLCFTEVVVWTQLLSVFYRRLAVMDYISTGMGYCFSALPVSLMALCLR